MIDFALSIIFIFTVPAVIFITLALFGILLDDRKEDTDA